MKRSLIWLIAGLTGLFMTESFAQNGEPALIVVKYQFKHRYNLLQPDSLFTRKAVLLVGKSSSRYTSWYSDESLPGVRIAKREEYERQMASSPPTKTISVVGTPMVTVRAAGASFAEYVQHPTTQKLNVIENVGIKGYAVETALPAIKWEVSPETKTIGSYECQKATGRLGGREYVAWFAPGLAFGAGPWKLHGLPGVILEAFDTKGDVRFDFVGVERIAGALVSDADDKWLETGAKDLERLKKAWEVDPASVVQGQVGSPVNTALRFMDVNGKSVKGDAALTAIEKDREFRKSRNYNPLELVR